MVPGEWHDTGQVRVIANVAPSWARTFCVELEERGCVERAANVEWTGPDMPDSGDIEMVVASDG